MDKIDKFTMADKLTDVIFLSLIMLQEISGKSQEEVLAAIEAEGKKTDALLDRLL